jgi:hypothetical protein
MSCEPENRMSTETSTKLQELPLLRKPELMALWQELFGQPAHPKLRRDLMIPILAFGIQEQAYGGLEPTTRKRLQQLAAEREREEKVSLPLLPQPKPGTKLLRQWQGPVHQILTADDRFEYRAKRYKTLSQIARQITGTRWSGPLFFGLKHPRKARSAR